MTTGRHLVHEAVYDDYVGARWPSKAEHLPVGDPADRAGRARPDHRRAAARQGPRRWSPRSVDAGARLAAGGTYEGLFYRPTVLADVAPAMPAVRAARCSARSRR